MNIKVLRKKFALAFSTNGKSASVHYRRKIIPEPKLKDEDYTVDGGVDPGLVAFFGCTTVKRETKEFTNFLVKSKDWNYSAGLKERRQKQTSLTGAIDNFMRDEREQLGNLSQGSADYELFAQQKLRHFGMGHDVYSSRAIKNLSFEKIMKVRSMLDVTSNTLCPKNEMTRMMYGRGFAWKGIKG